MLELLQQISLKLKSSLKKFLSFIQWHLDPQNLFMNHRPNEFHFI